MQSVAVTQPSDILKVEVSPQAVTLRPGQEAKFLAPLDVRDIPGVGKVMEQNLHAMGIRQVGDLSKLDEHDLEERFGKWGLALAGKARDQYVAVTLESTTATNTTAYQGLRSAWHVALATVTEQRPGQWVVSGWQPEN